MKKTALLLTAAACAFSVVGLLACDNTPEPEPEPTPEEPTHECSFVLENTEEKYLATVATCVEGATYYKSCECGEKGTETFVLTLLGNHAFGENDVCTVCGNHKATEGLEYAITDDHAYVKSVSGVTDEVIYIDSVFNGCPVTGIIKTAFKDCKTLKKVVIPNGITSIGENAFSGSALAEITLPESVTSIDKTAFDGCANSIYKEEGNAYYLGNETNSFLWLIKAKNTAITECTINEDCKHICYGAFDDCSNLTVINYNAINCADMIGGVFATSDKNGKDVTVKIGKDVKRIPSYVFYFVQTLTKVEFESGSALESVGDYAFFNCIKITSIDIPASVNSIGDYVFYRCTALKTINFGGTMEQWNAVAKGENWNVYMSEYKIVCTDGEIE